VCVSVSVSSLQTITFEKNNLLAIDIWRAVRLDHIWVKFEVKVIVQPKITVICSFFGYEFTLRADEFYWRTLQRDVAYLWSLSCLCYRTIDSTHLRIRNWFVALLLLLLSSSLVVVVVVVVRRSPPGLLQYRRRRFDYQWLRHKIRAYFTIFTSFNTRELLQCKMLCLFWLQKIRSGDWNQLQFVVHLCGSQYGHFTDIGLVLAHAVLLGSEVGLLLFYKK